jgi:hypothetical protein
LATYLLNAVEMASSRGNISPDLYASVGNTLELLTTGTGVLTPSAMANAFGVLAILATPVGVTSVASANGVLSAASNLLSAMQPTEAGGAVLNVDAAAAYAPVAMAAVGALSRAILSFQPMGAPPLQIATPAFAVSGQRNTPAALEGSSVSIGSLVSVTVPTGALASAGAGTGVNMVLIGWAVNPYYFAAGPSEPGARCPPANGIVR